MEYLADIKGKIVESILSIYSKNYNITDLVFDRCKKEFVGDYTLVTFAFSKNVGESPELVGNKIGEFLLNNKWIHSYNVIKGFLNI